jgi:hypothetical protein
MKLTDLTPEKALELASSIEGKASPSRTSWTRAKR